MASHTHLFQLAHLGDLNSRLTSYPICLGASSDPCCFHEDQCRKLDERLELSILDLGNSAISISSPSYRRSIEVRSVEQPTVIENQLNSIFSREPKPVLVSESLLALFTVPNMQVPIADVVLLTVVLVFTSQYSRQANAYSWFGKSRKTQTNDIGVTHESLNLVPASRLSPVILLPGDGGSRLEAKLDRKDVLHKYCERRSDDWFALWVNLSLLVPFAIDCWVENMKLVYNTTTRRTLNAPGVTTRVNGFTRTESVEWVDPSRVYGTNYFDALVRQLVAFGYERNKNIFGAPYDFRRAPNELEDFFADLEKLVTNAYSQNDNEPVVFICHSMGCLYGQYLLSRKPREWKQKYVRSMITLGGVYGGSVKAMKAYASGDNFGVVVVPSLSLRKDIRTFPSLALLMPSPEVFPSNQVLMRNRDKQYTVNDYKQFFHDIDYPIGYEMWLDVRNLTTIHQPPGVEVHCLHGIEISTPESLSYENGEFPDSKPKVKFGNGDGTVNLNSLRACLNWSESQKEAVYYKNFTSVDHMTILSDSKVMDYIGEALSKKY